MAQLGADWESDPIDEAAVVMDTKQHEMHEGELFTVDYLDTALANNGNLDLLINVTAPGGCEVQMSFGAGGDATARLYESPVYSDAGAAKTIVQRNRTRTDLTPDGITCTTGPTLSNTGTEIMTRLIAGGSGGNSSGSVRDGFGAYALDGGKKYLLRLTNIAGSAKACIMHVNFTSINGMLDL